MTAAEIISVPGRNDTEFQIIKKCPLYLSIVNILLVHTYLPADMDIARDLLFAFSVYVFTQEIYKIIAVLAINYVGQ